MSVLASSPRTAYGLAKTAPDFKIKEFFYAFIAHTFVTHQRNETGPVIPFIGLRIDGKIRASTLLCGSLHLQ
jgi:hypothetical protein